MSSFFRSPSLVYGAAIGLRVILLFYGAWQDANSPVKYTDIDYMVFTDAARYVSRGDSPYARDTYRYTPLLAWMLLPTTWAIPGFFSFGKALFALSDVVAGWLVAKSLILTHQMSPERALKYASFWLLNPMVANISTRGSSEGLLGVLVIALLWAVLNRRITLAGILLGLGVHFKIYPFIYGVSIIWWLDNTKTSASTSESRAAEPKTNPSTTTTTPVTAQILAFITPCRIRLTVVSLLTFAALNVGMYLRYGTPFLQHTYFHHLTRIDHRHNFSPYSTLLYLSAAADGTEGGVDASGNFESLAFIPQLLLSVVLIPLVLGKKDLPGTMLAQTFAFVTYNKVCTSQYFLWYLIFLPFYLPTSSLLQKPRLGLLVAALWVAGQALWLQQAFYLEFLGVSSFVPGLFLASLGFFAVNAWILGIIVADVGRG
ncbi:Putative Mannosyltransferase [Aspergillus calidoustus]|uniref:GPI mannosyltransferase 1 n=1 Tax=Aspergillus calidoustus TaxID=454130 RepID=A0A0U5G4Q6_ASPCI|nr:Putative Mannosyltransferase [Aspergillus calidoustus]